MKKNVESNVAACSKQDAKFIFYFGQDERLDHV